MLIVIFYRSLLVYVRMNGEYQYYDSNRCWNSTSSAEHLMRKICPHLLGMGNKLDFCILYI